MFNRCLGVLIRANNHPQRIFFYFDVKNKINLQNQTTTTNSRTTNGSRAFSIFVYKCFPYFQASDIDLWVCFSICSFLRKKRVGWIACRYFDWFSPCDGGKLCQHAKSELFFFFFFNSPHGSTPCIANVENKRGPTIITSLFWAYFVSFYLLLHFHANKFPWSRTRKARPLIFGVRLFYYLTPALINFAPAFYERFARLFACLLVQCNKDGAIVGHVKTISNWTRRWFERHSQPWTCFVEVAMEVK